MKKIILFLFVFLGVLVAKDLECKNHKECFDLGLWYYENKFRKGNEIMSKLCKASNYNACYNLGVVHSFGKGVKQDYKKAKELYEKACNDNNYEACLILGLAYAKGKRVKQDYKKAKMYFGKACDLGSQLACSNYRDLSELDIE